jgi:hypothetical protein
MYFPDPPAAQIRDTNSWESTRQALGSASRAPYTSATMISSARPKDAAKSFMNRRVRWH